jgi:hypothetical protein
MGQIGHHRMDDTVTFAQFYRIDKVIFGFMVQFLSEINDTKLIKNKRVSVANLSFYTLTCKN